MTDKARPPALAGPELLERDAELARTANLLVEARAGRGRLLVIEGPAGIGKTALLQAIRRQGADGGFDVLRARGGQLEREFPHGVVRQLFETHLHAQPADERASVLSGAAILAGPVVLPEAAAAPARYAADPAFAVAHGLYWLTANLADRRSLLLLVDDVHWADLPSLRFLLHLARRVDGLPALLVLAVRTGEPPTDESLLMELVSHPDAELLRPSPLSQTGVGQVIATGMGRDPDPQFASACQHATGGIPFLVTELVSALAERGIHPCRESVPDVSKIGPETVAHATLFRLGRLMPGAAKLAQAVAVLGGDGRLGRAARLAGIDPDRAVELADALVSVNILRPGVPLEFTHPIVRSAIYDDISPPSRMAAHSRAAELLVGERADIDAVAGHLLLTDPAARPESAERLRTAAQRALTQGAPDSAATYLRRALDEGGLDTEQRAALLHELGRAERPVRPGQAIEYLEQSRALATDPDRRAQIVYELGDALFWVGEWKQAVDLVESAIGEFTHRDPDLVLRLEAMRAGQASMDARLIVDFFQDFRRLRRLASAGTPGGRLLAIVLAHATAWLVQPPETAEQLLELALDGRPVLEHEPESWIVQYVLFALVLTENLDRALAMGDALAAEARRRGSRNGFAYCLGTRAWIHSRRGALPSAEADVRIALEEVRRWGVPFGIHTFAWCGLDAMLERPELGDEADRLESLPADGTLEATPAWTAALEARGRMRLVRGDIQGAVEDLTRCGETVFANGNPNGWGWQPALALALAPTDAERALELATTHLEAARVVGLPRAIGIGLRTLGLVEGGAQGLADLEQAVSVLEGSPARLEHGRALVELGAARRRANQRAAAREPLRLGLDLAHRCGATRLEQHARAELTATGARPRRAMLSGRDALTASEQRIAAMAAEGMSNPEIAQALFVTRKTVENHLARAYVKLGIHSRDELPAALARSDS